MKAHISKGSKYVSPGRQLSSLLASKTHVGSLSITMNVLAKPHSGFTTHLPIGIEVVVSPDISSPVCGAVSSMSPKVVLSADGCQYYQYILSGHIHLFINSSKTISTAASPVPVGSVEAVGSVGSKSSFHSLQLATHLS